MLETNKHIKFIIILKNGYSIQSHSKWPDYRIMMVWVTFLIQGILNSLSSGRKLLWDKFGNWHLTANSQPCVFVSKSAQPTALYWHSPSFLQPWRKKSNKQFRVYSFLPLCIWCHLWCFTIFFKWEIILETYINESLWKYNFNLKVIFDIF